MIIKKRFPFSSEQVSGEVSMILTQDEVEIARMLDESLRSALLAEGGIWAESAEHESRMLFIWLVMCTQRDTLIGFQLPGLDADASEMLGTFMQFTKLNIETVQLWKAAFDQAYQAYKDAAEMLGRMNTGWDNLN